MTVSEEESAAIHFLSRLAHDLRNLLEGLEATVFSGQQAATDPVAQDLVRREILTLIIRTERQADLFDARRASTVARSELGSVALGALCRQTVRSLAPFLQQREVVVEVPEDAGATARADRGVLARALASVCHATLRATAEDAPLHITHERDRARHSLILEAGGLGATSSKVGEAPFRIEELDACREILRSQGGELSYRIDGSIFRVRMRLTIAESDAPDTGKAAVLPGEGERERDVSTPARVLVVDDNEDSARSLAALLEIDGYRADVALDASSALELARSKRHDAILLDLSLPDMDGFEVCRELRAGEATRGARIIAVTGYGHASIRRQAEESGFDAHLLKPVDPESLRRALNPGR